MRLFVTGGAGYIGSHAVRRFREAGHEPWVFDNLSTGHRAAVAGFPLLVGDLGDEQAVASALASARFDAVVHFAGAALVAESIERPLQYFRQNASHGIVLLEAMRNRGIDRLVMSSSCTVYGNPPSGMVREDFPLAPINPYARSKVALEWCVADCAAAYGLGAVVLRYFNAAGAHWRGDLGEDHSPESHLIPNVLRVALGQQACIPIHGTDYPTPDGTCVRDYIHVEDLAEAHLLALDRVVPGRSVACNLGSGAPHSVQDVIAQCREETGHPIPALVSPLRPGDAASLFADIRLARELLDWTPRHSSLENIVASAWAWHSRNPTGYGEPQPVPAPVPKFPSLRRTA
ncbi:MAG: UDP-glucose 4-epimerase GalE [Planctomycetaceae bacterium]